MDQPETEDKSKSANKWDKVASECESQDLSIEETQDAALTEELPVDPKLAAVLEQLRQAQSEMELVKTDSLRRQAEAANVMKRARDETEKNRKYAIEKLAVELLAIADSMEMGLEACQQLNVDHVNQVVEGIKLTYQQLLAVFAKFDIAAIAPTVGDKFNPGEHNAMGIDSSSNLGTNCVVKVMQKGYRLQDRVIRPALVMVSK